MGYLVYKHISPSGKVYIGITSRSATRRWNNGRGYIGSVFHKAIEKYGWDNIKHEVLYENLSRDEAVKIERDLIKQYDSTNAKKGYNIVPGGGLGISGYKFTEEQRKKLSQSHKGVYTEAQRAATERRKGKPSPFKGKKRTKETIEKIRLAQIERYKKYSISEETREKLRKAHGGKNHWNYGRTYSDDFRKKLSIAHIGQQAVNKKAVICLETKEIFESEREATKRKGYLKDSIGRVCRGVNGTVKGTHWMYLNDYNKASQEEIEKRIHRRKRNKKVICIETGEVFLSGHSAARKLGLSNEAVNMCCRGLSKTCGGLHWRYVEEVT